MEFRDDWGRLDFNGISKTLSQGGWLLLGGLKPEFLEIERAGVRVLTGV